MSIQISATTNPVPNANWIARDVNGITAILHNTTILDDISAEMVTNTHKSLHNYRHLSVVLLILDPLYIAG